MKPTLSISRAWEETRAAFARDGRLFTAVALALIVLPTAIIQFAFPGAALTQAPRTLGESLAQLAGWVIGLIGQLAIARLAATRGEPVGRAIGEAARQMPWLVVAMLLLIMALFLLFLPVAFILTAMGMPVPQDPAMLERSPTIIIASLLFGALVLFVATRMLMTTPVAALEDAGPVRIIRRSWELTRGHVLRLLGFLLLFALGVLLLMTAVMLLTNVLVTLFSGAVEPFTVPALLLALVRALLSGIISTSLTVILARIYVQLRDGAGAEVTVPHAGG